MKKINQLIKTGKAVLMLLFIVLFSISANAQAFIDATNDVTILPVSYLSFTGYEINNTVVLKWATAREISNSHFNIQRSSNGIEFENIDKVTGKGNFSSINEYSFTDAQLLNGNLFYRLQQVDVDGKSSNSSILVIKKSRDGKADINVYPNPLNASNNAFLSLKGIPNGKYSYSLMNISGQILSSNKFIHVGSMSTLQIQGVNNMQQGVYTLFIQNNEGQKIDIKQIIIR